MLPFQNSSMERTMSSKYEGLKSISRYPALNTGKELIQATAPFLMPITPIWYWSWQYQ